MTPLAAPPVRVTAIWAVVVTVAGSPTVYVGSTNWIAPAWSLSWMVSVASAGLPSTAPPAGPVSSSFTVSAPSASVSGMIGMVALTVA